MPNGPRPGRSGPCAVGAWQAASHGRHPAAKQLPAWKSTQEQFTGCAPELTCFQNWVRCGCARVARHPSHDFEGYWVNACESQGVCCMEARH